jgi:hypothetical protein
MPRGVGADECPRCGWGFPPTALRLEERLRQAREDWRKTAAETRHQEEVRAGVVQQTEEREAASPEN